MKAMEAREVVIGLLETYEDALHARASSEPGDPNDSRALAMSYLWHEGSYAALESILAQMKTERRDLFSHVRDRYLRARKARQLVRFRKGKPVSLQDNQAFAGVAPMASQESFVIVWTWGQKVSPARVEEGIDWILGEFRRRKIVPQMPLEFLGLERGKSAA